MNSVCSGSIAAATAAICFGSVVSSTWIIGLPLRGPTISAKTSGPRLDPPMPRSTADRYWAA